jgi:hypothetical protein
LNSDDLTVEAERRGDADYLIAAGMSRSRLGGLLKNLQSEWDGVAKPRRYTQEDVERIAKTMPRMSISRTTKKELKRGEVKRVEMIDYAGARAVLKNHYAQEMKLIGLTLRSFVQVRDAMRARMMAWGHEHAQASDVAHDLLMWWLAPICDHCHGTKYETIENTNRLSARACRHCHGSGEKAVPHARDGKRLLVWVDDAYTCGTGRQRQLLRQH